MTRTIILAAAAVCLSLAARAQTAPAPAPSVWPVPQSVNVPVCQGGTGSPVTSVGTTAVTVCAAPTSTGTNARTYYRINALNAAGGSNLACTDNGVTPVYGTTQTFPVYAGGYSDSSGFTTIGVGAIQCISQSGTVAIYAQAEQIGTP